MNINKEELRILWFEDENGKIIPHDVDDCCEPKGAIYQRSEFPRVLHSTCLGLIRQEDVDKCKHQRKYRRNTFGWIDGVYGRECVKCHGTQLRKRFHRWPKKWDGRGSYRVYTGEASWPEDVVLAMANSGDYTLSEAILVCANACERCLNALAYKYGCQDGYAEGSEEWQKCGTQCRFCEEENQKG